MAEIIGPDGKPLGRTGEFPDGKVDEHDHGALRMAIATVTRDGSTFVDIDFGEPIAWLALPPDDAANLATLIMKAALMAGATPPPGVQGVRIPHPPQQGGHDA